MLISRRIYLRAFLLVGALLCLVVPASAFAGGPATATVRVEGLTETKLLPTSVTTTTSPVSKAETSTDSCPGTSALGALQLATAGNWSGPWEAEFNQYSIYTIEGETHEFEASSNANYYWSFWLDNKEATVGACAAELQAGDQVLFFPACYGAACPTPEPTPLAIEAPTTANAGEQVNVTVEQYNSKGEAAPAVGANVGGGGTSAVTDSQGHATLKFAGDGTYTLRSTSGFEEPPAIRDETTICVHEGNDGTCGTARPGAPNTNTGPPTVNVTPVVGDTATIGGVKDGRHYSRRKGPRILQGLVQAPAGGTLREVRISLQRRKGKHCTVFSGTKETFVRARCGATRFFSVGDAESFSYLLPTSLPPGRYVYDIEAIDGTGKPTKLVPGVSHVVFYVK
ncbi:MAG TPA: DUF4430 domain-containing protein [Solirubrobacteraceae bacterium]|jgi:hypothetical protein|nr:DUF4430 domain-containing protein [Solirubrobacteraceae bacterium]